MGVLARKTDGQPSSILSERRYFAGNEEDTMIFRLSQKLSTKIKAGPLESLPLDDNPLVDWSAGLFLVGRSQYVFLCNTISLYSTVMEVKGITNRSQFIESSLASIQQLMSVDGYEAIFEQYLAPASESVRFAKALNRSVTGSMNELINEAECWLLDGELSPQLLRAKLNDNLLSALGTSKSRPYGTPRDAFELLVIGIEE
jgi:hypothetical protein